MDPIVIAPRVVIDKTEGAIVLCDAQLILFLSGHSQRRKIRQDSIAQTLEVTAEETQRSVAGLGRSNGRWPSVRAHPRSANVSLAQGAFSASLVARGFCVLLWPRPATLLN